MAVYFSIFGAVVVINTVVVLFTGEPLMINIG